MQDELLQYLGLDPKEVKTIDDFKTKFDAVFVRASSINENHEIVKPITGKFFGKLDEEVKKLAKAYAIDITTPEYKELTKVSEKMDYVLKKKHELSEAKIAELEAKVGLGNDEKLKEAVNKYGKLEAKTKQTEELIEKLKTDFDAERSQFNQKLKGMKLSTRMEQHFANLKLKATITELEREGFNSIVNKKYRFDLDENDKEIVLDAEGKRIPSKKTASTFKTVDEVLEEEVAAQKLGQENPQGGKPVVKPVYSTQTQQQIQQPAGAFQRKVAEPLQ